MALTNLGEDEWIDESRERMADCLTLTSRQRGRQEKVRHDDSLGIRGLRT